MTKFKKHWQSLDCKAKNELAKELNTSYSYLSQIANGHRAPGKHFKLALDRALSESGG